MPAKWILFDVTKISSFFFFLFINLDKFTICQFDNLLISVKLNMTNYCVMESWYLLSLELLFFWLSDDWYGWFIIYRVRERERVWNLPGGNFLWFDRYFLSFKEWTECLCVTFIDEIWGNYWGRSNIVLDEKNWRRLRNVCN